MRRSRGVRPTDVGSGDGHPVPKAMGGPDTHWNLTPLPRQRRICQARPRQALWAEVGEVEEVGQQAVSETTAPDRETAMTDPTLSPHNLHKGMGGVSEPVERVARALAPSSWAALGTGDTLAHQNRRTASLRHARKAIEVLRDFTPVVYDGNGEVAHQLVGDPKSVWLMFMSGILSAPALLSTKRGDND